MFWSFSFQLLPDEQVIEESVRRPQPAIKASYSVFLTNKRVIFRFDGLGSTLTQSFFYQEITGVTPVKRLFITYLDLKTEKRNVVLNISEVEYWAGRIREMKKVSEEAAASQTKSPQVSPGRNKRELLDMLTILHKNSLLSNTELEEKVQLLDSMKLS
jgi:hypothetical protein